MAATDSDKRSPRYFIAYGWSEGPWHSRRMRGLLEARGFEQARTAEEADIIIAHSLGCYLIPRTSEAKAIMLIGLPCWPGRPAALSVLLNTAENIRSSLRSGSPWWLEKLLHNLCYIIIKPSASYYALTRRRLSLLPKAGPHQKILLVRNAEDMFCHPDIRKIIPARLGYAHIDMSEKLHEDCWLNPEPYVKLVGKYHG